MHFSLFIPVVVLLGSAANARPVVSASQAGVAAVYFQTNLEQNSVVSNAIAADGKVSFAKSVKTRGSGSAGVVATPGADPLFSQDSVKVAGSHLFVVNAGSNTVSMFKINPNDPTSLRMVGNPVCSGGEFPVSIAVSEAKNMVCVLNGGAKNGVSCYKPDPQLGLKVINGTIRSLNLPQTTPPSGPAGSVSDILFSQDGTKLFASVKGVPPTPGFLAAWDIAADGTLSAEFEPSTPAPGGLLPFSATLVNGQNALLVTDPGAGFSVYDLNTLNVANKTPANSSIVTVDGQKAICWSNFSPKTGNYYLTDIGTSIVTEASVDANLQGAVVKQYPLTANSSTIDNAIASLPANDFLYVLSASTKSIDVLALNAPGAAAQVQSFGFESDLRRRGITIDANRLQGMAVFVKGQ